jgi:NitT/TauT family transport system permease protein
VAASQLNTPRVFSLILYLSLVGLSLFAATVWMQRWLVFWKKERISTGEV